MPGEQCVARFDAVALRGQLGQARDEFVTFMPAAPPSPPAVDDVTTAVVRAAAAGDRQACRAIWEQYTPLVQRLVYRYFGPEPDQADVCQEAFLRVFRRLRELRDPVALPSFIIGITLGVARNESRRRRIRAIVGLSPSEDLTISVAAGADSEARESVKALYKLLSALGAEERSLFVARFVERMGMSEVAEVHAISVSTAKRRVNRLALRLQSRMKSEPALAHYAGLLGQGEEG